MPRFGAGSTEATKERVMIDFECGHCGSGVSFPEDAAGSERTCPHCGKMIRVPAGAMPGFPGDVRKPSAAIPPAAGPSAPSHARHAPQPARSLPAVPPLVVRRMESPPTEEMNLCAFLKWFFLICGFVAGLARIITGIRWYAAASAETEVDAMEMATIALQMLGLIIAGVVLYTVFACLGRIVAHLYLVQHRDR